MQTMNNETAAYLNYADAAYAKWVAEHPDHDRPECCEGAADYYDAFGEPMGCDHSHDCDEYDGAPIYRDGMGPGDPVRCAND